MNRLRRFNARSVAHEPSLRLRRLSLLVCDRRLVAADPRPDPHAARYLPDMACRSCTSPTYGGMDPAQRKGSSSIIRYTSSTYGIEHSSKSIRAWDLSNSSFIRAPTGLPWGDVFVRNAPARSSDRHVRHSDRFTRGSVPVGTCLFG